MAADASKESSWFEYAANECVGGGFNNKKKYLEKKVEILFFC